MTIEKTMECFNIIVETVWLPLATALDDTDFLGTISQVFRSISSIKY